MKSENLFFQTNTMRILMVDPNQKESQSLVEVIKARRWVVEQCENSLQALNKIRHICYDIIFVEIYLPIMSGLSLVALIKNQCPQSKVIIITREKNYQKRIQAFHAGVDEYLIKPVSREQVLKKIARLAKQRFQLEVPERVKTGDLVLNLHTQEVFRSGEKIDLKKKEFDILMFMVLNKGKVLNRYSILENVWECSTGKRSINIVDVYMNKLREKLDKRFKKKLIETVYGIGYKFCEC